MFTIDTTHAQPLETSPNPCYQVLSSWRPSLEASPNHHQVYLRGTSCTTGDYRAVLAPYQGKAKPLGRCSGAQELQARLALQANRKDSTGVEGHLSAELQGCLG